MKSKMVQNRNKLLDLLIGNASILLFMKYWRFPLIQENKLNYQNIMKKNPLTFSKLQKDIEKN